MEHLDRLHASGCGQISALRLAKPTAHADASPGTREEGASAASSE